MSGPIFGNSLSGNSGGNRHLVEFRAGRMNMVGKMVHPDLRKGLVYMYQAEDGLIHFCWKDRTSSVVEDDLIIFPDDCEFKRVEACKTGRVFLLKFKSSSRKLFFWLQEPKTDKDEEWTRRVNEVMNNPPSMNNVSSGGRGSADGTDLQYMLNNMSQQQLMQLFGGVGQMGGLSTLLGSMNRPSSGASSRLTTTTTTSATTTSTPSRTTTSGGATTTTTTTGGTTVTTPANATSSIPSTPQAPKKSTSGSASGETATSTTGSKSQVLLSELQNYLSGLNPISPEGGAAAAGSRRNIDLSTAINSDSVSTVLSDPSVVSALQAHLPNIDTGDNTKDQLKETLTSPQFQQALSIFSSALQSGQLGPVVSQFQLNPEAVAAANSGDLEQFIKALEKATTAAIKTEDIKKEEKEGGADKKDTKDDTDDMQLG